jgi:hypothetical protein
MQALSKARNNAHEEKLRATTSNYLIKNLKVMNIYFEEYQVSFTTFFLVVRFLTIVISMPLVGVHLV